MNFQSLITVEKPDFYLDVAFRKAREKASLEKSTLKVRDKLKKQQLVEKKRIESVRNSLSKSLRRIVEAFPRIDALPPFYVELVKCTLDYGALRKSLGGVNWADKKVHEFSGLYLSKISKAATVGNIAKIRAEYYGRMSSFLKRIKDELAYIEQSRRIMKKFPTVKTSCFTVTLFGFPNVGKTTMLNKLTGSKPEINSYPFTTKGINIGYRDGKKIQFLDVPGALNRKKMNQIEKQGYLALKYCSNLIVYVFDLTEQYPIDDQKELLREIKRFKIPVIVFVNKADITDKKMLDEFNKKFNALTDINALDNAIKKFIS